MLTRMADTYLHVSGIPAIGADALVDLNRRLLRAVQEKRGGDQGKVVVDNSTAAVTAALVAGAVKVGIAGAAAGNHTVTGILTTNTLVAVVHVDDTTHASTDKTAEYTISASDTINNTSGTTSVGSHVVVVYV